MPKLIHLNRFSGDRSGLNPLEYFVDCRWDTYSDRWDFDVSSSFPYEAYTHIQTLEETNHKTYLIDLRKFVERQATGDVVYDKMNLGYKWCWNVDEAKSTWERNYTSIRHSYWVFHFESLQDLDMWRLIKPTLIVEAPCRFNPLYTDHNENNTIFNSG